MKKFILVALATFFALNIDAQNYNSTQETLRNQIANFLDDKGYKTEKQDDGLKFKVDGVAYYVEIDKEEKNPMYVRLCRYLKYSDNMPRSTVAKNINDYNVKFGVKVCCLNKWVVISSEMFITKASQFNYVFSKLLSQMEGAYDELTD